uniref:Uncharacterized protein n=1 Tax=Arion vulgaris TaxID=1028688 RepID=A0A0B7A448_9EUPU
MYHQGKEQNLQEINRSQIFDVHMAQGDDGDLSCYCFRLIRSVVNGICVNTFFFLCLSVSSGT